MGCHQPSLLPLLGLEEFQFQSVDNNLFAILLVIFLFSLQGIFSLIASMSIAVIVERVISQKEVSAIEAVTLAFSKLGKGILTSLYLFVIVFALTLLFVIPGIIYSNYYLFVLYVVALRNKSGGEALDYSKMLVEGQWWRVFGVLLGAALIFGIAELAISLPLSLISNSPYMAIITNAITLFSNVIFTVMPIVLFLNSDFSYHRRLAKRKEMEISRKIKKIPSIEEYVKDSKTTKSTAKRSSAKMATVKSEKSKAIAKRSTRKKE